MRTLDTESTITLTDGDYRFVAQSGSVVRLQNVADGTFTDMHLAEVAKRKVGLPTAFPVTPRLLERVSEQRRDSTIRMADHLEEILTGVNPAHNVVSPEYDLTRTTQNQRIEAKVRELTRQGIPASRRTLMRKLGTLRNAGTAGLVDRRSLRNIGPLDRAERLVTEALCEVIADEKDASTGTKSRLIRKTHALLIASHGADAPPLPSTATMYRYIDKLTQGKHTTGKATTRRSLGNRPNRTFGHRDIDLPGQEMQVDSTELDVFVTIGKNSDGTDMKVKPILSILSDRATRMMVAFTIRIAGTTGVDHAALLAQALTPPQNRPDLTLFRANLLRTNPGLILLSPARRAQLEATRPYIVPSTIVIDNGADYRSKSFTATAESLGINIVFSPPGTPVGKSMVERKFGSIGTMFNQYQPGYTGNSPVNRGKNPDRDQLLNIHALTEKFDDWILDFWNNRPHPALYDQQNPHVKLSPNQKFAQASAITSTPYIPLTRDDYIAMLQSEVRLITDTGIRYNGRDYDSPELHPLRNQPSSDKGKNRSWEVKVDQRNPFAVWVRSPENVWIECPIRNLDHTMHPHLEEMVLTQTQIARNDIAAINTARAGTPMHLTAPTEWDIHHTDFDTDTDTDLDSDTDEYDSFDPTKD